MNERLSYEGILLFKRFYLFIHERLREKERQIHTDRKQINGHQGLRREEPMRNDCLVGMGFLVGVIKMSWNQMSVVILHWDYNTYH